MERCYKIAALFCLKKITSIKQTTGKVFSIQSHLDRILKISERPPVVGRFLRQTILQGRPLNCVPPGLRVGFFTLNVNWSLGLFAREIHTEGRSFELSFTSTRLCRVSACHQNKSIRVRNFVAATTLQVQFNVYP